MKQPKCANCGDTRPLKYLTIDRETREYLCPSCYSKSRLRNENAGITAAVTFIVIVIIIACVFGYIADLFFLEEVVK